MVRKKKKIKLRSARKLGGRALAGLGGVIGKSKGRGVKFRRGQSLIGGI